MFSKFIQIPAYYHFNSLLIRPQPCHAMCNLLNSDSADEKLSTKKLTLYGRKFYICQTFVWSPCSFGLRPDWKEWENKMFYQLKITSEPSICNGEFGWVSAEHFERLFTFHWAGDRLWELPRSRASPTTTSGGWPATSPPPAPPLLRRRRGTPGSARGGTWRSSRCCT